jgi:hypothetical protein
LGEIVVRRAGNLEIRILYGNRGTPLAKAPHRLRSKSLRLHRRRLSGFGCLCCRRRPQMPVFRGIPEDETGDETELPNTRPSRSHELWLANAALLNLARLFLLRRRVAQFFRH